LAPYLDGLERMGVGLNVCLLVGTTRSGVQ